MSLLVLVQQLLSKFSFIVFFELGLWFPGRTKMEGSKTHWRPMGLFIGLQLGKFLIQNQRLLFNHYLRFRTFTEIDSFMKNVISHTLFSDYDIYLFKEGNHFQLYEKAR